MKEFENDPNSMNENPFSSESNRENISDSVSDNKPSDEPSAPENEADAPNSNNAYEGENPNGTNPYEGQNPYGGNPYGGNPYGGSYQQPYPPYQQKQPKKQGSSGVLLIVFCLVLAIFVGVSAGTFLGNNVKNEIGRNETTTGGTTENTTATSSSDKTTETEQTTTATAPGVTVIPSGSTQQMSGYRQVVEKCIHSVVMIDVTEVSVSYGQEYEIAGSGSGVIYTADGYIVTNYHVANKNTRKITVTLYDGSVYEGKYIYGDEYVDIAVIKIEKNDCVYAEFGDYSQVYMGDQVLAIGNPLGYGIAVTDGIVSALDKAITIENTTMVLLQTSAEINSGNSGGGLFNMNGELIGIVNAKIAGTSVEGMGYAIPSSVVAKSLNDLREYGYITGKARLGVTVATKQYQTWPYMQTHVYIQVTEINPNGSAAASGIKVGDILYRFNDAEITSFEVLSQQLTKYKVGDTVTLTVRRPTIELTGSNLSEYLSTSETVELTLTFVEFNPDA